MDFQQIRMEDRDWISELLAMEDSRSCDYDFTNLLIWDYFYRKQGFRLNHRLLLRVNFSPEVYYIWPVGSGDLKPAIDFMKQNAACLNIPLRIYGLEQHHVEQLHACYPGEFDIQPVPEHFDYLYDIEKMCTLSGRQLHGKRNHLNRFIEKYQWSFEPITETNLPEARDMIKKWFLSSEMNASDLLDEKLAIDLACQHYHSLQLDGGLIRIDGVVCAVTIGNLISSDTFCVHFEKALREIEGGYTAINYEFSNYIHNKYPFVRFLNREDDLGIESLRKAKHSYYPEIILEKYTALLI